MSAITWTCPHCDQTQVSTDQNRDANRGFLALGGPPHVGSLVSATRCLNSECGLLTVDAWIGPWHVTNGMNRPNYNQPALFSRRLVPEGAARPMPEYVPAAIRKDYEEACLIRDLSPKSSATLARRCIQGMIRDFAKIKVKSNRLVDEIKSLENAVDEGTAPRGVSVDSIEALTAIRKLGNIGAHMEADIDLIVDVDPGEAQVLIDLIESLIEDWYVESHKRAKRFGAAVAVAAEKQAVIANAKSAQPAIPNLSSAATIVPDGK